MGGNRERYNQNISNTRGNGRREFYHHDDRNDFSSRSDGYRGHDDWRGNSNSFKRGYRKRGFAKKVWNTDVQMSEGKDRFQQYYENSRKGRRGSHYRTDRTRDKFHQLNSHSGWHKVVIKNASQYDQRDVLSSIRNNIDDDFIPHLYDVDQNDLSFYIEGNVQVARAILKLSGRVTLETGQRLHIVCLNGVPPPLQISSAQIAVIERVMSERYVIEMDRIDLRNFHNDRNLVEQKIFCPLYRPQNLQIVMEIIVKNISTIKDVDLSQNMLTNVFGLELLLKCHNLERLDLGKNRIRFDNFSKLTGLGITELSLEGNPICSKFKDADAYTSVVRKYFPKVILLDGVNLPKPISFGLDDLQLKLPQSKGSFIVADEAKNTICKFVEQYYQVFESDDRRPLEAAYTIDSQFSFVIQDPKEIFPLFKESRNLIRENTHDKKKKKFSGNKAIIDLLSRFPICNHDPSSFVLDIPFVQPQLMHVILSGVFRFSKDTKTKTMSFMRTLIIVPVGSGFCISNEELFLCLATHEQITKSFKSVTPKADEQNQPGPSSIPTSPSASDDSSGLTPVQVEMVKQFVINSKMLPQFCRVCLETNDWDFNKAGEMFLSLQKENKIPPQYFGV